MDDWRRIYFRLIIYFFVVGMDVLTRIFVLDVCLVWIAEFGLDYCFFSCKAVYLIWIDDLFILFWNERFNTYFCLCTYICFGLMNLVWITDSFSCKTVFELMIYSSVVCMDVYGRLWTYMDVWRRIYFGLMIYFSDVVFCFYERVFAFMDVCLFKRLFFELIIYSYIWMSIDVWTTMDVWRRICFGLVIYFSDVAFMNLLWMRICLYGRMFV